MKRISVRELTGEKLHARLSQLRKEVSLLRVEQKVKQEKNTNLISSKRKEIARILTRIKKEQSQPVESVA